jgi:hypothetical protein
MLNLLVHHVTSRLLKVKTLPEGKRFVRKPRKRWLYDDEKMDVRSWRIIYRDRDTWKLMLKEARVLHGPCIQWRRGEVRQKKGTGTVDNRRHLRTRSERSYVGFTQGIVLAVATVFCMNCCPKTIAFLLPFWVMYYMMVMFHCIA